MNSGIAMASIVSPVTSFTTMSENQLTSANSVCYWEKCKLDNISTEILKKAVKGGNDSDGVEIFIGKAFHNGDEMPAKVMPKKKAAYACYNGKEIPVSDVEILCERKVDWVSWKAGNKVPKNAFVGGKANGKEDLYIARAKHEGSTTIGKLHDSHKSIYIPYGGKEHAKTEGEVLVIE